MVRWWIGAFLALALASGAARASPPALGGRPTLSLSGTWEFRFAPDDRGDSGRWHLPGVAFGGHIRVPGCWEAQGVGEPNEKLFHNAIGVGWYRRKVNVPADWRGRRVWLVVGGAHRTVRAWINGRALGEHVGYPVAARWDLTPGLQAEGQQTLVLAVDSRWHRERDPLAGAFDLLDYMDQHWGGIFEQVYLEATGDAWLEHPFIQPDPARESATVEVGIGGTPPAGPLAIAYTVRRWHRQHGAVGRPLASGQVPVAAGDHRASFAVRLPGAPLWTPEQPHLLVADLSLAVNGTVLDRRTVRFGQRRLEVRGADFLLNGERFFLRGYGDDYTFPLEITPEPDVARWRRYLQRRREFGFNGVRHHSTMPSESYLAAADEVGIFVQPELPIAYEPFFAQSTPEGREVYRRVWRDYILQMRNHPSVFAWCMGNEQWAGFALGPELYTVARQLDPTRPVIDSDGVWGQPERPTLDYLSVQFAEGTVPWGRTLGKYRLTEAPRKPVIVHEMSNLSVLPDPADIPRYTGVVKPFWIEAMAAQVKQRGLQRRLPAMLTASRKLQASLLKLNIEAARLSPDVDGHHQWLFRDYWCQSTGLVNQFDQARALTPAMVRRFNAPAVLLWERDRVSFRSGEAIPLRIFLSDFRPRTAPPITRVWVTLSASGNPPSAPPSRARVHLTPPRETGGRGLVGPWTGTLHAPHTWAPVQCTLQAGAGAVHNAWPLWVFPAQPTRPAPTAQPRAGARRSLHTSGAGTHVARFLSQELVQRLAQGASVFVTDETAAFPTLKASFKTAWWHGDDLSDHVYGNLLLPHPSLRGFPAEGYGDLQMAALLDDRPVVLLDDVPGNIEPIVWCLDVPWQMRRKAYLFEARVGAGRLLVSTLNFSPQVCRSDPAAAWLLGRLRAYVASPEFRPRAELPIAWLGQRVATLSLPPRTTWVEGYDHVVMTTEPGSPWYSYREDRVTLYPVRQTDGRQRLTWRTAAVPTTWGESTVTFVWAGGIGWQSQPEAGHFVLSMDGAQVLQFPFTASTSRWVSTDGRCSLSYVVRRRTPEDTFGIFFLTVPAERVRKGAAAEIAIAATGEGSRRWFALTPYRDVVAQERME